MSCSNFLCSPGYSLSKNKNCVICGVDNCAKCTAPGVCAQCQSGYYLANSSSCEFCGYGCEICASETTCKTCNSYPFSRGSYVTATGACGYCRYPCIACKSSKICTLCQKGYTLSGFRCRPPRPCIKIDPYCISCDKKITRCTACNDGLYLKNNKCFKCGAGCAQCTNDFTCLKCAEGYYLNANDGCSSCIQYCKACQDLTTCTECLSGFEYDADKRRCSVVI